MAISQEQQQLNMNKFLAAKDRARKLISQDARQEVMEGKKFSSNPTLSQSFAMEGKSQPTDNYYDDSEMQVPDMLNEAQMQQIHQQAQKMPIVEGNIRNNKLPKEILNAFKTNPIDTSALNEAMGMDNQSTSILDTLGIQGNTRNLKMPKQRVNEQSLKTQPQVVPQSVNIDYSLIKTIVEESVKKYTSALKKSILTENTNVSSNSGDNLVLMKLGESFKFVTSNGDIFEAKLIKKGNINENKKKQ